jgi:methylenetetrahydrofolate--tRNA-(uracil-5-)-methyltransferase
MKPAGLVDPKTERRPWAVVQLRSEDAAKSAYNLVGFQTRLTGGEQARIFRTIPGLEQAEFLRYGAVHRNTFLNAPRLLDQRLRLKSDPRLRFAGQITGVEGYVESAACGWLAAWFAAAELAQRAVSAPPASTAHGGLLTQLARNEATYQPSNITFSHLPPWEGPRLGKRPRYEAIAQRALDELARWIDTERAVAAE